MDMPSQIKCITKPHPHSDHEAITHVGGNRDNGNGAYFYITRQQCADDIRLKRESYFVHVGTNTIAVEAYERGGNWYIRTKPDNTQRDNLLSLPQCVGR
jgi:hypothetical protein